MGSAKLVKRFVGNYREFTTSSSVSHATGLEPRTMIAIALLTSCIFDDSWSKAFPAPVNDAAAMLQRNYGQEPFRDDLPLYRSVTKEVERTVAGGADLVILGKEASRRFDKSKRLVDLAKIGLYRYYHYSTTRQLNVVSSTWYENAWIKVLQNPVYAKQQKVDLDPHDYWLSRIRFLADSCQYQDLAIRQIGYRLYKHRPADILVSSRLAMTLVLDSEFERKLALKIVSDLQKSDSKDWRTWVVSAHIYHWSGIYTKDKRYLSQAISAIDRAVSFPDMPASKKSMQMKRRAAIESELRTPTQG